RLRLIGGVDISDYLDVIAPTGREEDIWHALLQHRAGQPVEWDLHGIRAASPTATLLPALAGGAGLTATMERRARWPGRALAGPWADYLAGLSGKDRHELRRKIRRLERELPGATARSHGEAAGWDEALTRFLTLHRLSKVGKARFMDERMERFFPSAPRPRGWPRRGGHGSGSSSTRAPRWPRSSVSSTRAASVSTTRGSTPRARSGRPASSSLPTSSVTRSSAASRSSTSSAGKSRTNTASARRRRTSST